ncbi:MAG: hypothetical protein P4L22_03955 [Candidatus Babeliales bacterium]|nr:hypothetical protein [Candidatus Babeliales bacterium]
MIFSLLYVILFITISLKADFFAFRRLIHPETKKVIYLLYDVHASIPNDPSLSNEIINEIKSIIKDPSKIAYYKKTIGSEEYKFKVPWYNNEHIKNKLLSFADNLPNLSKQHNDLLDIIKNNKISLINEDWPPRMPYIGMKEEKELNKLIKRHLGTTVYYKKTYTYIAFVTPLLGIGEKLTGKFTESKFVALSTGAYYFNPDFRNPNQISSRQQNKEIDNLTLQAIDILITQYNQSSIVIAEGFSHIQAIARNLVNDQGYVAGPFIISEDLEKRRKEDPEIDKELEIISSFEKANWDGELNNPDNFNYSLVLKPLNIKAVFNAHLFNNPELEDFYNIYKN